MQNMNQTIFQFFHWYYPVSDNLWNHAASEAGKLAALGVTQVWLPPAYKSAFGAEEPGYAVYDLYDLGEFDQKGSIRTRYGTRQEYQQCIRAFQQENIKVLADVVLNHKHGGDETETIHIRRVNPHNRKEFVDGEEELPLPTRFTFPARNGKYSEYVWDFHSFTGVELQDGIGMIVNEYSNGEWEEMLEDELGNFDFLMGNDIEYRNPAVREELKRWGKWYVETTGVDGFRLDALKHINPGFYPEWLDYLQQEFNKTFICIGEYWKHSSAPLLNYIDVTRGMIPLFDVPLHYNFHEASRKRGEYDLRTLFNNTLTQARPTHAISFVDNHDTQPLQSLESTVDYWFKPHAYAIILLREQGIPCVFYPALYEARYVDHKDGQEINIELVKIPGIEEMMKLRAKFAYGMQRDYFDDPQILGWTREGAGEYPQSACAVLVTNGEGGEKKMWLGSRNAGKQLRSVIGGYEQTLVLDEEGAGNFPVPAMGISVWIDSQATL